MIRIVYIWELGYRFLENGIDNPDQRIYYQDIQSFGS